MIDLHLIGYTPDLRHIVLELQPDREGEEAEPTTGVPEDRGRYRLEIDVDLFRTLDEVLERRRAIAMEAAPGVRLLGVEDRGPAEAVLERARQALEVEFAREGEGSDEVPPDGEIAEVRRPVAVERQAAPDRESSELPVPPAHSEVESQRPEDSTGTPQPESRLTPAEIQALLRAGRSLKTVAKLAGIDVCRVERWLTPILAERAQVIQEAQATPVRSDGIQSRWPLVAAVTHNLSVRGTDPGLVSWTANRRVDGRWTVQLRYRDQDRARSASWNFDRRGRTLTAGSQLAHELGWIDDPGDCEDDKAATPRWNGSGGGTGKSPDDGRGEGQGTDPDPFV